MHSLHKKLQVARLAASTTLSLAVIGSLGYSAARHIVIHEKKQERIAQRAGKIEHEA